MSGELASGTTLSMWLLLAAVPILIAACTAFTKVSVVLAALRVGLGAESLLPYAIFLSLSVVISAVIMGPTIHASYEVITSYDGLEGFIAGGPSAWWTSFLPLRDFMLVQSDPDELIFFAKLQGFSQEHLFVLIPAFLVTELSEALSMAVLILLPFVMIDLIISQILTLMSLSHASSGLISLPAKILLFLAIGGWDVLIGGLVEGYA